MIPGHIVAAQMVRQSTHRHLTEPPRTPAPPRRLAARALQAAALRLDPRLAPAHVHRVA